MVCRRGPAIASVASRSGSVLFVSIVVVDATKTRAWLPRVCRPTANIPRQGGPTPKLDFDFLKKNVFQAFSFFTFNSNFKYPEIGSFDDVACLAQSSLNYISCLILIAFFSSSVNLAIK